MESIANKSTGRRATRPVCLGGVQIGGEARVSVQTMTKTDTGDAEATLAQIKQVAAAGADLVRVALPNAGVLGAFERICAESPLPVVADVHFDYRLAVEAARRGAAKLRINPGNLGGRERLAAVLEAAHEKGIPVRVGVNAGSLPQDLEERHGGPTAEAMAQAAQRMVAEAQELGFSDLVVSLKASDVPRTVQANRLFAAESDLPLHLGVTEAGLGQEAVVRSAVGIGTLLAEGIGDTIRVSLTGEPAEEVRAGRQILQALGMLPGPVLVACPTCGRCRVDLRPIVEAVRAGLEGVSEPLVVAVMGCEVNGPGEAKHADVGLAAGANAVALFRRGEIVKRVPVEEAAQALLAELDSLRQAST
jgi:(E)-4-hydroxy-3-methylbut-2-enyl-diphosphate synthase